MKLSNRQLNSKAQKCIILSENMPLILEIRHCFQKFRRLFQTPRSFQTFGAARQWFWSQRGQFRTWFGNRTWIIQECVLTPDVGTPVAETPGTRTPDARVPIDNQMPITQAQSQPEYRRNKTLKLESKSTQQILRQDLIWHLVRGFKNQDGIGLFKTPRNLNVTK